MTAPAFPTPELAALLALALTASGHPEAAPAAATVLTLFVQLHERYVAGEPLAEITRAPWPDDVAVLAAEKARTE